MHLVHGLRLALQEVPAGGPHREDEGEAGPLLPHVAQVVHLQAEARGLVQRGAQRGVADQHRRVGLAHHQRQVRRAGVVVRLDAVLLGQQQLGQPHRRPAGGAEGDPAAVQLVQRHLADDHAGQHRAVAADGDVRHDHQLVGVAQVLDAGDRGDVELSGDQGVAQPLGGVLGQVQVEEGPGPGQAPVDRQAVQELDVPHAGTYGFAVRAAVRCGVTLGRSVHIQHSSPACPARWPCVPAVSRPPIIPGRARTCVLGFLQLQFDFPCSTQACGACDRGLL